MKGVNCAQKTEFFREINAGTPSGVVTETELEQRI